LFFAVIVLTFIILPEILKLPTSTSAAAAAALNGVTSTDKTLRACHTCKFTRIKTVRTHTQKKKKERQKGKQINSPFLFSDY
jgi:hypothetical protein